VTHDVKLVGEQTEVRHQIDVRVLRRGVDRRVLIECKDFDVSEQPVGLGIIRDFYGVVADVKPDEAFVITCNRFTDEAMLYAKGMNIKLAILRNWKIEDDEGLITAVHITGRIGVPHDYRITIDFEGGQQEGDVGIGHDPHADHESPLYLLRPGQEPEQLVQAVDRMFRARASAGEDLGGNRWAITFPLSGCRIQQADHQPAPVRAIRLEYAIYTHIMEFEVRSPIVSLILTEIGEGDDLLILEEDLKRFSIDSTTGEVVARPSTDSAPRSPDSPGT
jgi:hypothetical protein